MLFIRLLIIIINTETKLAPYKKLEFALTQIVTPQLNVIPDTSIEEYTKKQKIRKINYLPHAIAPLINGVLPTTNYTSGLTNKSRICYLNSVLQCLLHTKALYNYCIQSFHSKSCKRHESKCIFCIFEREVLANNGINRACDSAFSKFKNCFSDTSKENDAHEYMLFLLNEMIVAENLFHVNYASVLFQGKLRSKICSSCTHISKTIETLIFLSLVFLLSGCALKNT